MDDDTLNEILRERSKQLAKSGGYSHYCASEHLEFVEFILEKESYAIESRYIREVYPAKELTEIPCVPDFVKGIVNIRRKIVSVLDLKKIFNIAQNEPPTNQKILILHYGEMEFAILVDKIQGVRSINTEDLQSALPTMTGIRQDLLKGITRDRLIVLDGEKLLTSEQLVVNQVFD